MKASVKNFEVQPYLHLIDKIDTSKVSVKSLQKTIKLQKELTSIADVATETQKKIFKDYGVEVSENGAYSWADKENQKEISEKVSDASKLETTVVNSKFMNEDEFYESVLGLKVSEITALMDVLVEEEVYMVAEKNDSIDE